MTDILDNVTEVLDNFDQDTKPISEPSISRAVYSLRDPKDVSVPPMQWIAEVMAFDFMENYPDQTTGWGTYFGPIYVSRNSEGMVIESPSIKKVTEQIIQYWTQRAKTAKHPVLRARYADLVWDFSKIVTNIPPHYSMAQIFIDSVIEITRNNCYEPEVNVITKLRRALSLSIAINDSDRIGKVTAATIEYEDSITDDSKLGLWGFSYDLLFENEKVKLTSDQQQKLISDLEGHLQRASQQEQLDPWAVEAAASRLAKHYRKIGQNQDMRRVIVAVGDAFLQASSDASALQASAWLQRVYAIFKEFGLQAEAEEISIKLRDVGKKVKSELKPVSHTIELPKEELQKYISALTEGKFDDALKRITVHYIPKKSVVEQQLKELAKEAPIAFIIPKEIYDDAGRPLAKIGSLEEDLQGNTIRQLSQNIVIESIFLRQVLQSMVKKHPAFESLYVNYVFRSPIFEESRKSIIKLGVKEYLNGNHITAVHLLIPQIENAIRVLLEKSGGSILKVARNGAFNLKVLDELLRDPLITQVFGEDMVFYIRVLLVDPRGWNLRNCVCHGLCIDSEFESSISDRIIHILLCLALVREKVNSSIADSSTSPQD